MHTDARGHTITTSSSTAADLCREAMASYGARRSDTSATLKQAIDADPECTFTQAMLGLLTCSLRKNSTVAMAEKAYVNASINRATATRREQLYVQALELALARQPDKLIDCYETIINENPRDLFAIALAQGEAFWTGDMIKSEQLSRSTEGAWNSSVEGYGDWLAVRAFDLEETGDLANAERHGRDAIDLDPNNTWAAHAVAHVLEMRSDSDAGVQWLDSLKDHWHDANQLKFHLWWHRCLCHVERKEYDSVLNIYDHWIRNESQPLMEALPDFYLDVQNAASILQRMEFVGISIGNRWQVLGAAIEPSYLDLTSPFTSVHSAMTFAAMGDFDTVDKLLNEIEAFATTTGALAAAYKQSIPVIKGIKAHRLQQYEQVIDLMMPTRSSLWELGGSHAQRDILFQIIFDAARKLQRQDLMITLHRDLENIGFINPETRAGYQW